MTYSFYCNESIATRYDQCIVVYNEDSLLLVLKHRHYDEHL